MVAYSAIAAGQVVVDAPAPLDALIARNVAAPTPDVATAGLDAYRRGTQREVAELLATEGYFSPTVRVDAGPGRADVAVAPGPRTVVAQVDVEVRGGAMPERRAALQQSWQLKPGQPFRDADWREAKRALLRRLLAKDFPDARIVDSRADVDAAAARAALRVVYETGPRYVFGPLRIRGLSRYPPALVERYSRIVPGAPYEQQALLDLQDTLQRLPYFASVSVDLARPEHAEAMETVAVPVEIEMRERPPHRLSFGVGYGTNTGARTEAIYEGLDFVRRAWQLGAGVRVEQLRQSLYADVHLPPGDPWRDSFGVLADQEDIQGQRRHRVGVGVVRERMQANLEVRHALNWQRERREPEDAPATTSRALTLDGAWTLRAVDDLVDPRRGYVARLQAGGGAKAVLSDQNFLRLRGRYERFFPFDARNVVSLRGELGATLAASRQGVPEDFLFRAGGAQSVRGYAYQSLGVREGNAVVGGRYLVTASAEYTHWLDARWGYAVFVDGGDAGDDRRSLRMAVGYGVGARWKSPVGPLAIDLAYGREDEKLRLHFSLAVAF